MNNIYGLSGIYGFRVFLGVAKMRSHLFKANCVEKERHIVGKMRCSAFQRRKDHPKRISPRRLVDTIRNDGFSPFGTMAEMSWYDEKVRSYLSYPQKTRCLCGLAGRGGDM